MGFFSESFLLRMGERWVRRSLVNKALEFTIVFLDFFLAKCVDDLRSRVHALLDKHPFDFISVWFELEKRDLGFF